MAPTTRKGNTTPKKKPAAKAPRAGAKKSAKKKADTTAVEDVAENASPESVASSPNAASFEPAPAPIDAGAQRCR
jgi:hypothetical protein